MRVTMKRAWEQLLILLKQKDVPQITTIQFELGMARLEKRTLFTFVSSLYQSQERRLVIQEQDAAKVYIPDQNLMTTAEAALEDPELNGDQAKTLIKSLQGKVRELETRLQDFEDCSQKLSPEQLPQSQATGEDIWTRFRRCMPSFIDVVIDSAAQMQDVNFLVMSQNVQRKMISDLQQENRDNRKYEARYQKIVADLSKADDIEEKQMSQGTIKVINKHLLKENKTKQRQVQQLKREAEAIKTQNKVYKEFSEGKVSKQDLDQLISKAEHEQAEFQKVKLRKIKIEYIQEQEDAVRESAVVFEEGKGVG